MRDMNRSEAIDLLAHNYLINFGIKEREEILSDWWYINSDDCEYQQISKSLQGLLANTDLPEDAHNKKYDELIIVALRYTLRGVKNSYLSSKLKELGCFDAIVGEAIKMSKCACCEYYSLDNNRGYEICKVCFWEDDGTNELEKYSNANHMTLNAARSNFEAIGVIDIKFISCILKDGRIRFER
jgi:hypothetical protein